MVVCNFILSYTKVWNFTVGPWLSKFSVPEFSLSTYCKCKFPDNTSRDFDLEVDPGFNFPGVSVGLEMDGTQVVPPTRKNYFER